MRQMSVEGSFYPDTKDELVRYFNHFNKIYDKNFKLPKIKTKAVIVPHAGYIYSGYTANIAYRVLQNSTCDNFVVIGPSHRVGFDGISLCEDKSYNTPFTEIKSAEKIVNELKQTFNLKTLIPHAEHSTEVQFPFIKHYFPHAKIVELIYGRYDTNNLAKIITYLLEKDNCGVIISTDLSHFHNLEDAKKIDNICLNGIENLDTDTLQNGCEACGKLGVEAMIKAAKTLNLKPHLLDYRTSADASGDKSRVVGYVSVAFS